MMDMFAWLVKVRCYLQVGKNMAAYVLVKQLIALLEPGKRRMDLCECHMLLAIIYYKSGDQDPSTSGKRVRMPLPTRS